MGRFLSETQSKGRNLLAAGVLPKGRNLLAVNEPQKPKRREGAVRSFINRSGLNIGAPGLNLIPTSGEELKDVGRVGLNLLQFSPVNPIREAIVEAGGRDITEPTSRFGKNLQIGTNLALLGLGGRAAYKGIKGLMTPSAAAQFGKLRKGSKKAAGLSEELLGGAEAARKKVGGRYQEYIDIFGKEKMNQERFDEIMRRLPKDLAEEVKYARSLSRETPIEPIGFVIPKGSPYTQTYPEKFRRIPTFEEQPTGFVISGEGRQTSPKVIKKIEGKPTGFILKGEGTQTTPKLTFAESYEHVPIKRGFVGEPLTEPGIKITRTPKVYPAETSQYRTPVETRTAKVRTQRTVIPEETTSPFREIRQESSRYIPTGRKRLTSIGESYREGVVPETIQGPETFQAGEPFIPSTLANAKLLRDIVRGKVPTKYFDPRIIDEPTKKLTESIYKDIGILMREGRSDLAKLMREYKEVRTAGRKLYPALRDKLGFTRTKPILSMFKKEAEGAPQQAVETLARYNPEIHKTVLKIKSLADSLQRARTIGRFAKGAGIGAAYAGGGALAYKLLKD